MVDMLLNASILIGGIIAGVGSVVGGRYLEYFKTQHTEVWERLGRPGYFSETSWKVHKALKAFEKNKGYLQLNDPELTKRFLINKRINDFGILWLAVLVVLFVCHYLGVGK